jgi:hypothetical protein
MQRLAGKDWRVAGSSSKRVSGMAENVDITLLAKICQDNWAETKAMRRELAEVQRLAIKTVDVLVGMEQRNEGRFAAIEARFAGIDDRFSVIDTRFAAVDSRFIAVDSRLRGIDQRITDLKDDLQLMIKRELMGALGNFETRMAALIEERVAGNH